MLVELDGFATDTQVVVIAATNRADVLDSALVRAGRFDRKVVVSLPEFKGRMAILQVHCKDKKLAEEIDWVTLSEEMDGFSGAQLAQVWRACKRRRTIESRSQMPILELPWI